MSFYVRSTSCCGVKELDGVQDTTAKNAIKFVKRDGGMYAGGNCAFITFTTAGRSRKGDKLCEFIRENNLGSVIESEKKRNPNTGRKVRVWVWGVDWKKLKKF